MKRLGGVLVAGMVIASPALGSSLNPNDVFSRLGDRYTDVQRETFFNRDVKGKSVAWKMKVLDVSKGWWTYTLRGSVGNGREVFCKVKITDTSTERVGSISKGTFVVCAGTAKTYTRVFGLTLLIGDAAVR